MPDIECARCGGSFFSNSSLSRHLKSKTPCPTNKSIASREYLLGQLSTRKKAPSSFPCGFCKGIFTDRNNCYRHRKKCKSNPANLEQARTIQALTDEITILRATLEKVGISSAVSPGTIIAASAPVTINNTTNNNTNNTNNINIWHPGALQVEDVYPEYYDIAFSANEPVSVIAKVAPKPTNMISASPTPGDIRVFNGTRFIKNDNSLKCMYRDVWSKIQVYGDDNEEHLRRVIAHEKSGSYEEHRDKLDRVKDSPESLRKFADVLSKKLAPASEATALGFDIES